TPSSTPHHRASAPAPSTRPRASVAWAPGSDCPRAPPSRALTTAVFLLVLAIAIGWLSNRIGVAYPIVLVLAGIAVGFLPIAPTLSPATVLPPALAPAAINPSVREFRRSLRPTLLLAIGFVVVTTVTVALALRALMPDVPWPAAFAFGAIVSPPDAIAASAI